MTTREPDPPIDLVLALDPDPQPGFRADLGQLINAFHAQTVPFQPRRFALRLEDGQGNLAGGLSGVMAWQWLFIEALWVDARRRGKGAGRALMARAENHARTEGCHSVWLDSFQAGGFYEAIGYEVFAALENYPGDQTRRFLRKRLK